MCEICFKGLTPEECAEDTSGTKWDICKGRCAREAGIVEVASSEPISRFHGPWAFLSNFHPAVLVWEGITYPTSEHAFSAGKTDEPFLREWIASAGKPKEAKRRGHLVRRRDDWDETRRYVVMREVLNAKFTADPRRVAALLGTGDAELIEGNTWCDIHWGRCLCPRHNGAGENHLGLMLMELRAELKA
jgi:ribA/ribD-fused uncharacterized protein